MLVTEMLVLSIILTSFPVCVVGLP